MSAGAHDTTQHAAARAEHSGSTQSFLVLFGGPVAWFSQLCAGYALASEPCFIRGDRSWLPAAGSQWTRPAMIALMITAVIVALLSLNLSWRAFRRMSPEETPSNTHDVINVGTGRTRFLALWGIVLAVGFSCASSLTAIAFVLLPRCGG